MYVVIHAPGQTHPSPPAGAAGMIEDICEVIITAPDPDWLATFTRQLVADRLAACGHIINTIRSIYRWEGALHDETEARVALHTRRSLVSAITERAHQDHPYDVPCVVALPVVDGNPNYVTWVLRETGSTSISGDNAPAE